MRNLLLSAEKCLGNSLISPRQSIEGARGNRGGIEEFVWAGVQTGLVVCPSLYSVGCLILCSVVCPSLCPVVCPSLCPVECSSLCSVQCLLPSQSQPLGSRTQVGHSGLAGYTGTHFYNSVGLCCVVLGCILLCWALASLM